VEACAGDGTEGAEGLSGLAKAFFYAGSRALLVSHWPVVSDAAVKLTTGMLRYQSNNPTASRAEALRQSMLALMNDEKEPDYAHPLFWVPFVVVGEGGVRGTKAARKEDVPPVAKVMPKESVSPIIKDSRKDSPTSELKTEQEQETPNSESPWSSLLKSVEGFLPKGSQEV